jgi:hypothetical protein
VTARAENKERGKMIYNYICTHSLPEEIKIAVQADNEDDALDIATDKFFTQFEFSTNIDRDLGAGWKFTVIEGGNNLDGG